MTTLKKLRIFAASPTDTLVERAIVGTVAAMLKPLADEVGILLDVSDWSTAVPDMGRAEQVILDQLKPSSWDVFIGILWHRFGTPPGASDPETHRTYEGGTEEEFKTAYRLWRNYGKPRIMMYRCKRPYPSDATDPKQLERVNEFFAQFDGATGEHPGLYQPFDTPDSFQRLVIENLQRLLLECGEGMSGKRMNQRVVEALAPRTPENLPRRAPFFGRDSEMTVVMRALDPEDRTWGVLLDGIGGIGKTALAIEAAYRSKDQALFDAFIFVSAKQRVLNPGGIREWSTATKTLSDFLEASARVLSDAGVRRISIDDRKDALLDALRGMRTLLIFDNLETLTAEEQEALTDFLRQLPPGCKAIVTSRRRGGEGAVWLRLDKIGWDTARAIIEDEVARHPNLARKMPRKADALWQDLYQEAKGSPLALTHTLGLIRARASLTLDEELSRLRENPDPDLQKFILQEAERELTPNDRTALGALSVFAGSAPFEGWLEVAGLTRDNLEIAIDRLNALSLVDVIDERYSLHPLTRNFVRDELLKDRSVAAKMEERHTQYFKTYAQKYIETHSLDSEAFRELPETLRPLERLAMNYWWSWAPDGPEIFRDLDPNLWAQCEQNPRLLLTQISDLRLAQVAAEPAFADRVQQLAAKFTRYMRNKRAWDALQLAPHISLEHPVAYFCAEYGIHNSLPLYAGGLGTLAGDHLKSASDLNLPLVAIGLFYRFGYFRQRMRRDDWQEEEYRENHTDELSLRLVGNADKKPILIEVTIRRRVVSARVLRADIGGVQLYLLDTNVPENVEVDRLITGHLFGGDRETRLVQEMMLGIGGARLLQSLGIDPGVYHLNEGHSAFVTLELSRQLVEREALSFDEAAERVRERCVFTTHTPVASGHDEFDVSLVDRCFGEWPETKLGLTKDRFLALGRVDGDSYESFGLTPLALRMCRSANAVSRKHGEVSRELWHKMWPDRSPHETPITSVTNGVHIATWVAGLISRLYEQSLGEDWLEKARDAGVWAYGIGRISDEALWQAHSLLKHRMVAYVRDRSFDARLARGDGEDYIEAARTMFDPQVLTIGFARRVAGYKRWDLLLSDPERLIRLINDQRRPIQFVFAGKAHPQDQGAKRVLQNLISWQRDSSVRDRVALIEDYDQETARQLVQSVDVWMNLPRRPLEASGTSGQKVAINGGLNCSVLDGWWLEGYEGDNGFAIGDLSEMTLEAADRSEAESLYRILSDEVVPCFYERDDQGIPRRWVAMMKRSIQTLVPRFSSDRMVAEYAERIY